MTHTYTPNDAEKCADLHAYRIGGYTESALERIAYDHDASMWTARLNSDGLSRVICTGDPFDPESVLIHVITGFERAVRSARAPWLAELLADLPAPAQWFKK